MKIQYLGFLPAIIVAGVTIYKFIDFDMERRGFRTHKKSAVIVTIALFITVLGLIWGLSGI